jgi:hypothetical protein
VTDARLTLLPLPHDEALFTLACLDGQSPVSFALHGTTKRLGVVQGLRVVDGHCQTLGYQYNFALDEQKESWLIRWEYLRDQPTPDYRYPLAHVHLNGEFTPDAAASLPRLHVPTSRVPLELVLWHLIAEWGVTPKSADWREILQESIGGFEERRSAP